MALMHNQVLSISTDEIEGLYRVIAVAPGLGQLALVKLYSASSLQDNVAGQSNEASTTKPRPSPISCRLIWVDLEQLSELADHELRIIEIEPDSRLLELALANPGNSNAKLERDHEIYAFRVKAMAGFLNASNLQHRLLLDKGFGGLVKEAVQVSGLSRNAIYKLLTQLCRLGFSEVSLRPRFDLCGAPGEKRPCDLGTPEMPGRKKAGRKTTAERIAMQSGDITPPIQPGMNSAWENAIIAADSRIDTPKPAMPERCNIILNSMFIQKYRQNNGELVPVTPELGGYPNKDQIRRVLTTHHSDLERARQKTTARHFEMNQRGLTGKNWEGVSGPGHTYAIDSTVGDVFLRSSVDRSWILGRPVVYVIVDVWSTAIVGFYVCLTGPSWAMAKIALFSAASDPRFIGALWGYDPMLMLDPLPTLPFNLLCDRGEYLSLGAKQTGMNLIPNLSYAAPYRGDWKGGNEVVHRIEKDQQWHFLPGAIDARRKEYELRKSRPDDSVLTLQEYVAFLNTIFVKYNFTSDRAHRLDAHMMAAGVSPTPAGLWRWGHECGSGVQRAVSQADLITELLPEAAAKITSRGVICNGNRYLNQQLIDQEVCTKARNFNSWNITAHHFPGSVSRIWTPNSGGQGMMEVGLSDYSAASAELSLDEFLDAKAIHLINNPQREHDSTMLSMKLMQAQKEIIEFGKKQTAEAEARKSDDHPKPTMTEARHLELNPPEPKNNLLPTTNVAEDEVEAQHAKAMQAFLDSLNAEAENDL